MTWVQWGVTLLVAWTVYWRIFYWVFGFYVGYVTINNGILFNRVEWKTRKFTINASSVRFRLWGNSKRIIVLDLRVHVLNTTTKKSSKPRQALTGPLSIYPNHRVSKWVVKCILKIIPSVDVELKDSTLLLRKLTATLNSLVLQVKVHPNTQVYRYRMMITGKQLEGKVNVENGLVPLSMGLFAFMSECSLNISLGMPSNICARVHLDDLEANIFPAMKKVILGTQKQSQSQSPRTTTKIQTQLDRLSLIHNRCFGSFGEFSINIANCKVRGIPLFPADELCSLTEYLDKTDPDCLLSFSVKSASLHLARVADTAAGYDVLFDTKDKPVELTTSALLLKLSFDTKHPPYTDEFFTFPNCTFTFKSNINDNLAQGNGFRNCVVELFLTGSSPMLDVDAGQFALLAYNYVVVQKLMKHRNIRHTQQKSQHMQELDSLYGSDEETRIADSEPATPVRTKPENHITQLADKAVELLNAYYPRIDVKLTVEQPRAVIRLQKNNTIQLLMLLYSTLFLHVLTTDSEDYVAKCHLLHPCMTFSERFQTGLGNPLYQEEFCGALHARVRVNVMKNLKLKVSSTISGAFISLAKPTVLNGINLIINTTTTVVNHNLKHGLINNYYDTQIVREQAQHVELPPSGKRDIRDYVFNPLPEWLIAFDFSASDTSVMLGSTSPLLPEELIAKLAEATDRKADDTSSITVFSIAEFKWSLHSGEPTESSLTLSSLDTLAVDNKQTYWKVDAGMRDVSLCLQDDGIRSTPLFNIPNISSSTSAVELDEKKVAVDFNIDEIEGFIDKHRIFAILGLAYLLMVTIVKPLQKLRKKIQKNTSTLRQQDKSGSCTPILQFMMVETNILRINITIALSEAFKVRLQFFSMQAIIEDGVIVLSNHFGRLLADSPIVKGYWNRMVCLDRLRITINPAEENKIVLETPSLRIIQTHRFVVYMLFDNLGVFFKTVKHLVRCFNSEKKDTVVYPTESKLIKIPRTRVKATKLTFTIEDDPFEAQLNMIYQLGVQEQRKRMEIMGAFESTFRTHEDEEYDKKLAEVYKTIELLWIRKIQVYKATMAQEIIDNKEYLFGDEVRIPETENYRVSTYSKQAPLLHLIMTGVDLQVSEPKFPMDKLADFVYEYGQGVPKDTKYNLMIPSHIHMAVDELRMHMRDYPLPLLYLPKATTPEGKSLVLQGHMVINEALVLQEEHLRRIEVQLSNPLHEPSDKFGKLIIEKSMASVKLFSDLDILFDSKAPARFVWGQSYQFAIQQIMLNIDQFSKPPVDPSPKMGFWDKIRLIMHGKCTMRTGRDSSIEVALKGGRDPYNLFAGSSGFILSFKDHVHWKINQNDESLNFFDIQAKKVAWYIPNYLAGALVCWCRESAKTTFFPASKKLTTTCYGYYLNKEANTSDEMEVTQEIKEKGVVELSGGVRFVLGFLLQRRDSNDEMTNESKPHWKVQLYNPVHTKEGHDSYKMFRTDRMHMSISLVANTDDSYNTILLTPGAFKQFYSWWSLFHGNMMLPIRRGNIFGETKKPTKFLEHLFTIKYLFHLRNLFLSHVYRGGADEENEEILECVGLRGKMDDFMVDLHQRKEERIDDREELSRHKKILKMNFNRGEVSLSKIDLRAMDAKFVKDLYKQDHATLDQKCKYLIFDDDYQWFDSHDFDEAFVPSSGGSQTRVEVIPFMYSEKFSYMRDTSNNQSHVEWGSEKTHECMLDHTDIFQTQIDMYEKRRADLTNSLDHDDTRTTELGSLLQRIDTLNKNIKISESQRRRLGRKDSIATTASVAEHFHNRFVLISMFLKWNEPVRNFLLRYIHFVQLKANLRKYLSYEFITMLRKMVEKNTHDNTLSLSSVVSEHSIRHLKSFLNKFQSSQERFDHFDEIIRQVRDTDMVLEDYKVEIISPQIQLQSEGDKNSVVLVTAPILESKILSVVTKKESNLKLDAKELETRYGVLLHDACVMVLDKKSLQSKDLLLEKHPYGTTTNWPPYLGIEVCKNNSLAPTSNILIKKMSVMITYDQVKALGASMDQMEGIDVVSHTDTVEEAVDERLNRFRVDCPKLEIDCTSKQYLTLYMTVLDLLLYSEPMSVHLRERLSKLKFSINFEDFSALHSHLVGLHSYLDGTRAIFNNYSFRHASNMDNETLNEYLLLTSAEQNISTEIALILRTLFNGEVFADSSAQPMEDWRIAADQLTLHMLTDEREPILDVKIDSAICKRIVKEDGSNDNRIEIKSIEGINRVPHAYYDKVLEPIAIPDNDNFITVEWSMNRSIGGIRIMENFDISTKPLSLKIDEETGRLLMKFIFQTDEDELLDESPIIAVAEAKQTENNMREADGDETKSERVGRQRNKNDPHSKEVRFRSESQTSSKKARKTPAKTSTKEMSLTTGSDDSEYDCDVSEMIKRSKKYMTIVSMTSRSFELMISLRLKKGMVRWLNVTNFMLTLPECHIDHKVMSSMDVASVFRSLIIKALLKHVGLLIKNKLMTRGRNAKNRLKWRESNTKQSGSNVKRHESTMKRRESKVKRRERIS